MGRRGIVWFGAASALAVLATGAVVGVQASEGSAWWQERCGPTDAPPADSAPGSTLHGRITDPDGEPVEGALVRARQLVTTSRHSSVPASEWDDRTNAEGCYELPLALGAQVVVVAEPESASWAPRWLAAVGSVSNPPVHGGPVRLDGTLRPGATLSGRVTVPSSLRATAVLFPLDGDHEGLDRRVPVEDGAYRFAGLPAGDYSVAVTTSAETGAFAPREETLETARVVTLAEGGSVDDLDVEVPRRAATSDDAECGASC